MQRYANLQKNKYFICFLKKIQENAEGCRDRPVGHPCSMGYEQNLKLEKTHSYYKNINFMLLTRVRTSRAK